MTKVDRNRVVEAIYSAIDDYNGGVPADHQLGKSLDTPLLGRSSALDSVGLVGLIVAVEQAIADHFGQPLTLADDHALSQTASPFRTLGTLAEYVVGRLEASDG